MSPAVPGLRFQAVHCDDVGDAYRRAVVSEAKGPFNLAAEPVIGSRELVRGMREGADAPAPPLAAATSGPTRIRELLTRIGKRQ